MVAAAVPMVVTILLCTSVLHHLVDGELTTVLEQGDARHGGHIQLGVCGEQGGEPLHLQQVRHRVCHWCVCSRPAGQSVLEKVQRHGLYLDGHGCSVPCTGEWVVVVRWQPRSS